MWASGGVCRDGARVPLPWTADAAMSHGFSLTETAAAVQASAPWLPVPADWGAHAVELQQEDPESSLALVIKAPEMRVCCGRTRSLTEDGWLHPNHAAWVLKD